MGDCYLRIIMIFLGVLLYEIIIIEGYNVEFYKIEEIKVISINNVEKLVIIF